MAGSERRRREHIMAIRLSKEERDSIYAAAKRGDKTPASFVRQLSLTAALFQSPKDTKKKKEGVLLELIRVGNNLNQIAKQCNQKQAIIDGTKVAVEEARDLVQKVLRAAL